MDLNLIINKELIMLEDNVLRKLENLTWVDRNEGDFQTEYNNYTLKLRGNKLTVINNSISPLKSSYTNENIKFECHANEKEICLRDYSLYKTIFKNLFSIVEKEDVEYLVEVLEIL